MNIQRQEMNAKENFLTNLSFKNEGKHISYKDTRCLTSKEASHKELLKDI